MKILLLNAFILVCSFLVPISISANSYTTLKVHLNGGTPVCFTLGPEINFHQDEEGNLIVSIDNLEMGIPASDISHFSFSDELKEFSGIDHQLADEEVGSGNAVEVSYNDGVITLTSNMEADFYVAVYTLSGRLVSTFTGNPVEIDTTQLARDIYVLNAGSQSIKFTVK